MTKGYLREMAEQGYSMENIDPFHSYMVPWLFKKYAAQPEHVVVDIGAGQGHCLIPLHKSGYRNLTAVDIEEDNFRDFKDNFSIRCIKCDLNREPLSLPDESVDILICFHLIEHLTNPGNLMSEAFRVLRSTGILFCTTPDWRKDYKTFWRDPTHVRPYDKVSVARLFRMYRFMVEVFSWNARFGMGRLHAYRLFPRLGMIGTELLAVGIKG